MKAFLIITQILYGLSLFPWYFIWLLSFITFGDDIEVWNVSVVVGIGLYPIIVIVCSILAWVFRNKNRQKAMIINLIPLVVAVCALIYFWFG